MSFLIFKVEIIEFDGKRITITKKKKSFYNYEGKETRKHLFLKHVKENMNFV